MEEICSEKNYKKIIKFVEEKYKDKFLYFHIKRRPQGSLAPAIFYIIFENGKINYIGKSENSFSEPLIFKFQDNLFKLFIHKNKLYKKTYFKKMSMISEIFYER